MKKTIALILLLLIGANACAALATNTRPDPAEPPSYTVHIPKTPCAS